MCVNMVFRDPRILVRQGRNRHQDEKEVDDGEKTGYLGFHGD